MAASDILNDLKDDDILVVYRDVSGPGRRRASRITWGTVKSIVLALQPKINADTIARLAALEADAVSGDELDAETRARVAGFAAVGEALSAEIAARGKAVGDEAKARSDADAAIVAAAVAGTKSNADAIAAEVTARTTGDKANTDAIGAEATARTTGDKTNSDAIAAEVTARSAGDKSNADGLTAEAKARSDADAAMQARVVTLSGTMTLAAGLSLVVGKTERKVPVAGLKKGDGITVTPTVALPGNMTLGDAYCLTDGELSLSTIVTGTLALSISAKTDVPLVVKALR